MVFREIAYNKAYLIYENFSSIHNNNNEEILFLLDKFKEVNNLSSEDFIVAGAAAASYMDYLVLKYIKDIDIILLTDKEIEKTTGIDILFNIIRPEVFNITWKDGYQFISQEDFLYTSTIAAVLKNKRQNVIYTRLTCVDLGWSVDDLYNFISEKVPFLMSYSSELNVEIKKQQFAEKLPIFINHCRQYNWDIERQKLLQLKQEEENNGSNQTD